MEYSRQVNRLFAVAVDIQKMARPLEELALDMELLARNGVVRASKLDQDLGRPLGVLTSFLSELPDSITPVTQVIEAESVALAATVAQCTYRATVYQMFAESLYTLAEQQRAEMPRRRSIGLLALEEVKKRIAATSENPILRLSAEQISVRSAENLRALFLLIGTARGHVERVSACVEELRRTTRMSRYVYQCVRMEIAKIEEDDSRFSTFADRVEESVGYLEQRLTELGHLSRDGFNLLARLADGVRVDEE